MSNPLDKASPVRLEAATLLLDRAATTQFAQFLDALRQEYDLAARNMLSANIDTVQVAQGAAIGLFNLIQRIERAETTLDQYQSRAKAQHKEMN